MIGYKLTEEDITLLKYYMSKNNNVTLAAQEFCKEKELVYTESSRKKASAILHKECFFGNKKTQEVNEEDKGPDLDEVYNLAGQRKLSDSKFYFITWAQNETPVHTNFWNNILKYKEFLGAELSVILGRYKNPTSVFEDEAFETWDPRTEPFWDANRHDIHKYVTLLGDVKIQPTAVNPLTGLESITGETTTIIGHPKLHLKPIPVLEGHPKKILLTTGAVTVPNYTDSKAGKKAESHHKLGFTILEIKDEETFYVRQVEADSNGDFIDLFYEVNSQGVSELDEASAIVWGDTHVGAINKEILEPTEKLISELNIPLEIHHDLLDGSSVNNHIINNPVEQYKRWMDNKEHVEAELIGAVTFLKRRPSTHKLIIQSNHNDRFDRWILSQDWKKDITNAKAYLKYTLATLEGKADKGILAYVLEEEFTKEEVTCLDYDDSYIVNSYEVAHHGHIGSNGSKGSIEQFRKMSTNLVVGHYHKPMRLDRVVAVGTSTKLREGYNKGASDWLNAHAIIHKNNTVQHIIFIRGGYTTFKRGI